MSPDEKAETARDVISVEQIAEHIDSMAGHLRRRDTRGKWLFRMVVIAFVVGALIQAWMAWSLSSGQSEIQQSAAQRAKVGNSILEQTNDIKHLVEKVDAATSPEAKAAGDARLAQAIANIVNQTDCSSRAVGVEILAVMERNGFDVSGADVTMCPGPPIGGG